MRCRQLLLEELREGAKDCGGMTCDGIKLGQDAGEMAMLNLNPFKMPSAILKHLNDAVKHFLWTGRWPKTKLSELCAHK